MIELVGMEPEQDISIEYTGLRPGEKLYEELLAAKERTLSTSNQKIFKARVRDMNMETSCHKDSVFVKQPEPLI
jgi:FlaA1/EpsC-like NDP-sugar epimerase